MPQKTVAYQGEPGAFSEEAACQYFGRSIRPIPKRSFEEVFQSVHRGKADHGIVPIENSLHGSIHQNYDLLESNRLFIQGEIKLRIVHTLLAGPGVHLNDIRHIYSHPQALGQCERFLRSLSNVAVNPYYDTAGAAKMIAHEGRRDAAAIASENAARVYGLKVLKRGIESDHRNFTRFLILGRKLLHIAGTNVKTSILFALRNIPGALFKALGVFALREINLFRIESRPLIGRPWEYLFYLDFHGGLQEDQTRRALEHLDEIADSVKILGTYKIGKTVGGIRR